MIQVLVGQKIPLNLQVYDGNKDLLVECILFDKNGNRYLSAQLTHSNAGLYLNNEVEMPEIDYLIAQYFTNKPMDYEMAQDIFHAVPKVQPLEKYLLGEVIDSIELSEQDDMLIGEVEDGD